MQFIPDLPDRKSVDTKGGSKHLEIVSQNSPM